MSNAAGIPIARVTYWRKAENRDAIVKDLADLEHAVRRSFPDFPLDVQLVERNDRLYLTVTGYYRYIRMFTVRLLYRGWKIYRNIQILEDVAVRPTVSRAHNRNVWFSVASPAYNTREPLVAPMHHIPIQMRQTSETIAAKAARRRSADLYGLGMPYGQVAAHVAGLIHEQKNSSEATPSPERTPYETQSQYTQRKRQTQTMRNFEKRRAAILAVYEAAVEEKAKAAAAASGKQMTNGRRTTRKQTGPKER